MLLRALQLVLASSLALAWWGEAAIEIPYSPPSDVSAPVDSKFIGFAFELASIVPYAQDSNGNPNEFSLQLISNIIDRYNGTPTCRIGGNSGDTGRYIPDQQEPVIPFPTQDTGINETPTIGPNFWKVASNFNAVGMKYIPQIPLVITNTSEIIAWANSSYHILGRENIQALEIGNEPDHYGNTLAPGLVGVQTPLSYAHLWADTAAEVATALELQQGDEILQAFDISWNDTIYRNNAFDFETIFDYGINNASQIKQVAQHYYQALCGTTPGLNCTGGEILNTASALQRFVMNHTLIKTDLDKLKPFIKYCQGRPKGASGPLPFIMDEIGDYLAMQNYIFGDVLGTALWGLDFYLYSMSINISGVSWQQYMNSPYDLWLPVDSGNLTAQVFPNYYAPIFTADFIGNDGGAMSSAYVDTGVTNLAAYVAYANGQPKRVAMVNLDLWDEPSGPFAQEFGAQGSGSERPYVNATLTGLKCDKVSVIQLTSPQGAHALGEDGGISYAGSQFTAASGGKEVYNVAEGSKWYQVEGGEVTIPVYSTSAVMIYL